MARTRRGRTQYKEQGTNIATDEKTENTKPRLQNTNENVEKAKTMKDEQRSEDRVMNTKIDARKLRHVQEDKMKKEGGPGGGDESTIEE